MKKYEATAKKSDNNACDKGDQDWIFSTFDTELIFSRVMGLVNV